jgi:pimeloyl-ACP methyl ester carboxylesterase
MAQGIPAADRLQAVTASARVVTGRRRWLRRWLRVAGVAVAVWLAASWVVAYELTRRRRAPFDEPLPAASAAKYERFRLTTRDGQDLGAWYVAGRDDVPGVILLHGNGGSRWNCLGRAELLTAAGYPVLMVSLRAHGDSSGDVNDFGYGARHDVVAAVAFLEARRPGKPIVVMGTSMGGAAALFASAELGERVGGYILESPYRDLRTATWNRLNNTLPPVVDWVAYRGLLAVAPLVVPHFDRISPCEAARGVPADVPVLILAGANDRRARPHEARAILDRVQTHGRLIVFDRADHLLMVHADPERYRRAVLGFLESIAAGNHNPRGGASGRVTGGEAVRPPLRPGTPAPVP